jgi:hypothetical protein
MAERREGRRMGQRPKGSGNGEMIVWSLTWEQLGWKGIVMSDVETTKNHDNERKREGAAFLGDEGDGMGTSVQERQFEGR